MFDKKEYAFLRDKKIRGQGPYPPKYSGIVKPGGEPKQLTKKAVLHATRRFRKAFPQ